MADDETPTTDESEPTERWVIQNMGGSERKLGQVLVDEPGQLSVRFQDGTTFAWAERPKSVRDIAVGSVEWRSVVERPALVTKLRNDPTEVLVDLLRDVGSALGASDLRFRLETWGVVAPKDARPIPGEPARADWGPVWRTAQRGLADHAHVRFDERAKVYRYSAEAIEKEGRALRVRTTTSTARRPGDDVDAALRQVARQGLTDDRTAVAKRTLRDAHARGGLDATQVAAAMATLAVSPSSIEWSGVDLAKLPDGVIEPVFTLAARQGALVWIVTQLAGGSTRFVIDTAERAIGQIPRAASTPAAVQALEAVREFVGAASSSEEIVAGELAVHVRIVDAVRALQPTPPDEVVGAAFAVLAAVASMDDRGPVEPLVASVAHVVDAADVDVVGLRMVDLAADDVVALLAALDPLGFGESSARPHVVRAALAARPEVVLGADAAAVWTGLELAELAELVAEGDELAARLTSTDDSGLATTVTVPALSRYLAKADAAELGAMTTWPMTLQTLVPADQWLVRVRASADPAGLLPRALAAAARVTGA